MKMRADRVFYYYFAEGKNVGLKVLAHVLNRVSRRIAISAQILTGLPCRISILWQCSVLKI